MTSGVTEEGLTKRLTDPIRPAVHERVDENPIVGTVELDQQITEIAPQLVDHRLQRMPLPLPPQRHFARPICSYK